MTLLVPPTTLLPSCKPQHTCKMAPWEEETICSQTTMGSQIIGLHRNEKSDTFLFTISFFCLISRKNTEHILNDQSNISQSQVRRPSIAQIPRWTMGHPTEQPGGALNKQFQRVPLHPTTWNHSFRACELLKILTLVNFLLCLCWHSKDRFI